MLVVFVGVLVFVAAACQTSPLNNPTGTGQGLAPIGAAELVQARQMISQVPLASPGTMSGYDRKAYGPAWTDTQDATWGRNGCDTRNDVLNRDLTKREWKPNTHDCVVIVGILKDPYTGQTINFLKAKASKVQIDHVFPLGATWRMGADKWDDTKRKQIANDPLNLLAVDGPSNQKKSDSLPSEWLPPDKANRCGYVLRLAQVAVKYDLPVTQADKTTMVAQCPTGDATVTISPVTTAPAN